MPLTCDVTATVLIGSTVPSAPMVYGTARRSARATVTGTRPPPAACERVQAATAAAMAQPPATTCPNLRNVRMSGRSTYAQKGRNAKWGTAVEGFVQRQYGAMRSRGGARLRGGLPASVAWPAPG